MGLVKSTTQYTAAASVGLAIVAAVAMLQPAHDWRLAEPGPTAGDIIDEPAPGIVDARFTVALVAWGTTTPYGGSGPIGINLRVETNSSVVRWSLDAWANDTTPPPIRFCSLDGAHFDRHDWAFQADGGAAGGHGSFVALPSTVPDRLGTAGDQCHLRVAETGIWHVHLCVEGKPGGPLGIYDAEDGRHFDAWDRCVDKDFRV